MRAYGLTLSVAHSHRDGRSFLACNQHLEIHSVYSTNTNAKSSASVSIVIVHFIPWNAAQRQGKRPSFYVLRSIGNVSWTSRAAPGCLNTPNRVPELPYPHEGVSSSCAFIALIPSMLFSAVPDPLRARHIEQLCFFVYNIFFSHNLSMYRPDTILPQSKNKYADVNTTTADAICLRYAVKSVAEVPDCELRSLPERVEQTQSFIPRHKLLYGSDIKSSPMSSMVRKIARSDTPIRPLSLAVNDKIVDPEPSGRTAFLDVSHDYLTSAGWQLIMYPKVKRRRASRSTRHL